MNDGIFSNTMAEMNWTELEEMAKRNVPVLVPLGVIEEHGPHLPLGTDIYMSYVICSKVKEEAVKLGGECLIAPPYYFGITKCTGGFPGSFNVRPETMKMVLGDIFSNLKQFGFRKIVCINQHGDPLHMKTILEAIQETNVALDMRVRLFIEPYDLPRYGLSGEEDFCLVDKATYPKEAFTEEDGKLDLHAGAYETASMVNYYPDLVHKEIAKGLPDYSLTYETVKQWLTGGEEGRQVTPLGYAGNPAEFERHVENMRKAFDIMCAHIAERLRED